MEAPSTGGAEGTVAAMTGVAEGGVAPVTDVGGIGVAPATGVGRIGVVPSTGVGWIGVAPTTGAAGGGSAPTTGDAVAGSSSVAGMKPEDVWRTKDRLAAKRLRTLADGLAPAKRAVIANKSAFRAFLNVSPFHIPNELTEWVAAHTSPQLHEYKVQKKRFVFTRDMVRKVYGIRCGNMPVQLLKKSDPCPYREIYKAGKTRPEIATAIWLLKSCGETDEGTIPQSWDILCLALVVAPKSSNHISLEYLASMVDQTKTDQYAWDEHLLQLAMKEVGNIQKKKKLPLKLEKGATKFEFWITGPIALFGIGYMDHLEFPPNVHIFDYSVPRICSVKSNDFSFVVRHDLDRKILNNKTVFGWRPFLEPSKTPYYVAAGNDHVDHSIPIEETEANPSASVNPSASLNEWLVFLSSQELEVLARYKHLHEKHNATFASDVDAMMKNFAVGLKRMHSQHMSALFVDIDAAMKENAGPSVMFPTDHPINGEEKEDEQEDFGIDDDVEAQGSDAEAKEDERHTVEEKDDEQQEDITKEDQQQLDVETEVQQVEVAKRDDQLGVDSPSRMSPYRRGPPPGVSESSWNSAPDPPPMDLFEVGTDEYDEFNKIPSQNRNAATTTAADMDCVDKPAVTSGDAATSVAASKDKEVNNSGEPVTPIDLKEAGVGKPIEADAKDGSSGVLTHEKKTRFKRAAKEANTPPKMKKLKISKDVEETYKKFVMHGKKFKQQPKSKAPTCFVEIGRYFVTYKSFVNSLRPRQYLNSELMNVWIEKFNHHQNILANNNTRRKKKYAFSQKMTQQLIVDPKEFVATVCMKELKEQNNKYKILKNDILYFPLVESKHWMLPCVNIMCKQFHIFDSMLTTKQKSIMDQHARNLFENFAALVKESKLSNLDLETFLLDTPSHPQQTTLYDCGYFTITYMENFTGKAMAEFSNDAMPDMRKFIAADLIDSREYTDSCEKTMLMELQFS